MTPRTIARQAPLSMEFSRQAYWNSLGKNTGVEGHFLLQGIFLTQRSNLGLTHCSRFLTVEPQGKHILKNGSRPGHQPGCTAWGWVLTLASERRIHGLYLRGGTFPQSGIRSSTHLPCPVSFWFRSVTNELYLTGLPGDLLHRMLAGRPPEQESGCSKSLSFHLLFQQED